MKKEIYNIAFLIVVAVLVVWLYWPKTDAPTSVATKGEKAFVLAVSWQPAFCEQKPNKPECRSQHGGRYDATHFALHGLWLQKRGQHYCGVASDTIRLDKQGRWRDLPKLNLSNDLRSELARLMPGYRSYLHRHEWYKHGTCMGMSAETYFEISNKLIKDLNKSALRHLFANRLGREISYGDISKAFHQAYGLQAAERLTVSCRRDGNRNLINELKIAYRFDPDTFEASQIKAAIQNASKVSNGCKRGIVDPVGLQ